MGWVIERAAGRRYADLFAEFIWQPLGAETPAYITLDRLGAPRCAGGMCMTTRDLARVGQAIAEGGAGVIPGNWLSDILRNGDTVAWDAGNMVEDFPDTPMHYRAFFYVVREKGPWLIGFGIHGQNLLVNMETGLVMAKHASHPIPVNPPDKALTLELFERIGSALA
jgi:CubicO group peptidase (beta-lactamase class C family)